MTQPEAARDQSGAGAQAGPPRRLAGLIFCAGASLLLYLLLPRAAAMITSARASYAFEVFPWVAKVTSDSLAASHTNQIVTQGQWWFFLCCAALFAIYGFTLRMAKGCRSLRAQSVIFAAGAVFLVSMLFAPVMLSTDVFAYAFYGRVLSVYHANAYVENPAVSSDIFLALFHRQSLVSLYGPLWTLISAGLTGITGDRVGLTVLVFRGFSALASLCAAGLIWKSLRIFSPERATQGLVLFLWNPLVIIESGLSGHNDAVMVAFAALGVWLHFKGCKAGIVVALTLSALVKFITGMLVPLYVLMVLRGMRSWRERIMFLLRSGAAAGFALALVVAFARVKTDVPAGSQATSPGFYDNNFHELIFKGLRRMLGEDAESVKPPVEENWAWWAAAGEDTALRSSPSDQGAIVAQIAKDRKLLVIAQPPAPWLRVYDPVSHEKGYVPLDAAGFIRDPGKFGPDPELERLQLPAMKWPTVVTANRWIRAVTWALFAAFGLLAAWKTTDFDRFLIWSGAALLAGYFLVMTQIWPWYILWALAFGALKPGRLPARLAVLMSGCVLTFYITLCYDGGGNDWVYTWRSLPAIVLPLLIFLGTLKWEVESESGK